MVLKKTRISGWPIRLLSLIVIGVEVSAALQASGSNPPPPSGPIDYLIISHSALSGSALDALIGLKISQGFTCKSYTISDGVWTDSIRAMIKSAYDATDYVPTYVLLVGTARRWPGSHYDPANTDHYASAADKNFIPAPFLIDAFNNITCYDQWYTWVEPWDHVIRRPSLMIGRIPVSSTAELQNYVDKLASYEQHGADAQWKRSVLFLSGDKDRGPQPDYPSPVAVNEEINSLSASLPSSMSGVTNRYSDYSDPAARKTALVNAINLGQGLVTLLATGSYIDNLGYIVDRFQFDAATDLSNSGKYPVMLALSCNLGQFDKAADATHNSIAENLIVAPSRGVIGLIGPAGYSSDLSNGPFISESLNRLFNRGITQLGNLSFAAGQALKNSAQGLADTYDQLAVLGDPGLEIDLGSVTDHQIDFSNSMELTDPVPYQNRVYSGGAGLDSAMAGVVKRGQLEGRRSYRIDGYDKPTGPPGTYWELNGDLGITLGSASRFLTYRIKAEQHPESVGRFGVNCVVDGQLLTSTGLVDQYGTQIRPIARQAPLGQEMMYAFDLSSEFGKTVSKILVGYDAADPASSGHFRAAIDEIRLVSSWGLVPDVGSVQMPGFVFTNQTANVSVTATDPDTLFYGDALSVSWSVTSGYITGSGFNVVYHAPGSAVSNVQVRADVSDKGGHVVTVTKNFNVVVYQPPGCPHLSMWNGQRFEDEGAVLTLSRVDSVHSMVSDALPFSIERNRVGRVLRFALRENGNDVTDLEKIGLTLVTLDTTSAAPLGVTPEGHVRVGVDSIRPFQCIDQEGFDQVAKVRTADGNFYRAYGHGSVTLWYKFSGLGGTLSASVAAGDGAGLMLSGPPKPPNKLVYSPEESEAPDIVTVSVSIRDSGWVEVGRLTPRSVSTLLQLMDLSQYGDPTQGLAVKIEWNKSFSADDLCLYRFSRDGITELQLSPTRASHGRRGDVRSLIDAEDGQRTVIEPGDEISLEFNLDRDRAFDLGVMTFAGKYRPAHRTSGGGSDTSPQASQVTLRQNVPNPFNAETRIGFFLASEGRVTLTIYNALGQQVAVIADEHMAIGEHELSWNGKDGMGNEAPTGIYFYTLRLNGSSVSKKMVILK